MINREEIGIFKYTCEGEISEGEISEGEISEGETNEGETVKVRQ